MPFENDIYQKEEHLIQVLCEKLIQSSSSVWGVYSTCIADLEELE